MEQWISAYIDYMYGPIVRDIVIQRVLAPTPDEARIAAAVPVVTKVVEVLDQRLAAAPFLAGDALSLADLFVLPAVNYLAQMPEGGPILGKAAKVTDWAARLEGRDSAKIAFAA